MVNSTSPNPAPAKTALERAIELAGGPTALARALRARGHTKVTSHNTVNQWKGKDGKGSPPADYCPDIEDLTGVRCEELRPSANWAVVRQQSQDACSAEGAR